MKLIRNVKKDVANPAPWNQATRRWIQRLTQKDSTAFEFIFLESRIHHRKPWAAHCKSVDCFLAIAIPEMPGSGLSFASQYNRINIRVKFRSLTNPLKTDSRPSKQNGTWKTSGLVWWKPVLDLRDSLGASSIEKTSSTPHCRSTMEVGQRQRRQMYSPSSDQVWPAVPHCRSTLYPS